MLVYVQKTLRRVENATYFSSANVSSRKHNVNQVLNWPNQ